MGKELVLDLDQQGVELGVSKDEGVTFMSTYEKKLGTGLMKDVATNKVSSRRSTSTSAIRSKRLGWVGRTSLLIMRKYQT